MNKQGQIDVLSNPRRLMYVVGGVTIGYVISQDIFFAIIGGLVGFIFSFFS